MDIQERIIALGDIEILIGIYIQQNIGSVSHGDSWNVAGFDQYKINLSWGWRFQALAKPTLAELEAIKASLE